MTIPSRGLYHKRVLVTGGCGFIGSHFINHISKNPLQVWNLDKLTYAADPSNVEQHLDYRLLHGDVCNAFDVQSAVRASEPHFIVHFAAETHVDRSIDDSREFMRTNVLGADMMMSYARGCPDLELFIYISTDEVYGPSKSASDAKLETDPMAPSSPYAASKAGADLLARAYFRTHNLPVAVVRPTNNYGPRQFPEKVIPVFTTNALEGRSLPLYSKGDNKREWLYVDDCVRAIEYVLLKGRGGESYNVGSGVYTSNRRLAKDILGVLGKPQKLIKSVPDRPGHDFMYAVDSTKIRGLGWKPVTSFKTGLMDTVNWYKNNSTWWKQRKDKLK